MRFNALIAVIILGLGITAAPQAARAAGCSNATLKGSFGFASTVTQNNEVPPHFLELEGLLTFDGNGNASESFTFAQSDGAVGSDSTSMIYSVASNCTFTVSQDNGETFSGVIVRDGQEFYYIETTGACCGSAIMRRGHAVRLHVGS